MSGMSGHTPGPWHLEDGRTARIDHMNVCHSDSTPGAASGVIAKVTTRVCWLDEQRANARLIAAAPELLEALVDLVEVNERHNAACEAVIGRPVGWKDDYLNAARAAIARATGETK